LNYAHQSNQNSFSLKVLLILSFGHLATDLCQGALPAILPFLKSKLLLSYTMAGTILLISNVTSSVIQPVFGYWSDRQKKIFLLPLGSLFAGIGLSTLPLPDHYGLVVLLVTISGLGVAAYHPEGLKTARFFTGDKMATGLSIFTVGGNLGFALGPVVALFIITHLGLNYLLLILAFSLAFIFLLFSIWGSLSETVPTMSGKGSSTKKIPKGAYVSVGLIVATVTMRSWTHFGLMTYIPFYFLDYQKGDPLQTGMLVSAFLMGGTIGTLGGSLLADRWGYKRYLILSLALTTALMPLIFAVSGPLLFVVLGAVGMTLISSFTVTIVMAQELLPGNLGIASGLMVGFAIGTGGIGVTILGIIADRFGVPVALKLTSLLPLIGLLISIFIRYPLKKTAD